MKKVHDQIFSFGENGKKSMKKVHEKNFAFGENGKKSMKKPLISAISPKTRKNFPPAAGFPQKTPKISPKQSMKKNLKMETVH